MSDCCRVREVIVVDHVERKAYIVALKHVTVRNWRQSTRRILLEIIWAINQQRSYSIRMAGATISQSSGQAQAKCQCYVYAALSGNVVDRWLADILRVTTHP